MNVRKLADIGIVPIRIDVRKLTHNGIILLEIQVNKDTIFSIIFCWFSSYYFSHTFICIYLDIISNVGCFFNGFHHIVRTYGR